MSDRSQVVSWAILLAAALTQTACDSGANQQQLSSAGALATQQGALQVESLGFRSPDAIEVLVPLMSENKSDRGTPRDIRRAEVQVVESSTGTPLERFEWRFAIGEVSDTLPLALPLSFDSLDVRLEIVTFDDHDVPQSITFELPRTLTRALPEARARERERTEAEPSQLDFDKGRGALEDKP